MKSQEFFRDMERGNILPLYYFYGPEKWLVEEAVTRIQEKALNPGALDFNWSKFDAEEDGAEDIIAALQALPIRSPLRVVLIRHPEALWTRELFLDYLEDPNPLTCAIFLGEKADLRNRFFHLLEKKGAAVSFYSLYEKELISWIADRAGKLGHSISHEANLLLVERVGSNLKELSLELQKLILGKEKKERIEEDDVLAATSDTGPENLFDLPWSVGCVPFAETARILQKTLQQGEPPLLLFSLLIRQLRMIRRAQELKQQGCTKNQVEAKLRILPRRKDDFWKQVEKFSPAALDQLWSLNFEMDQELKTARGDKNLLLEKYLLVLYFQGGLHRAMPSRN
jgi:DNA polymerase III subunit delta